MNKFEIEQKMMEYSIDEIRMAEMIKNLTVLTNELL